jgi:pimeloyl-ACP methyl ester carboxylesterase
MMPKAPDVIWLNASPSLKRLHQPLMQYLSQKKQVACWEYHQSPDEPSSLDTAVVLLHDYLKQCSRPVHLVGHSTGGVIGLCYARLYSDRVASLTLLGVAAQPATTWHAHYYVLRKLFPCSRKQILAQMTLSLFGQHPPYQLKDCIRWLAHDLDHSPFAHSLVQIAELPKVKVSVPLLVCGSCTDAIVPPVALQDWTNLLKPGDRLWECPDGYHFFHYIYPDLVGEQIQAFWRSLSCELVAQRVG